MKRFIVSPGADLSRLRRGSDRRFYCRIEMDPSLRDSPMAEALAPLVAGLNRHLNACGCGLASVFVAIALAWLAWQLSTSWTHWHAWRPWATAFGVLCAAACIGKLAGLAYAHWRFRHLLDRLTQTLPPERSPLRDAAPAAGVDAGASGALGLSPAAGQPGAKLAPPPLQ